jgi:Pheophorbide a oxygenase
LFARFPFKFSTKLPAFLIQLTPRWYSHLGNNGVLEDDQIFLHQQERNLAAQDGKKFGQACYLPTRADMFVTALRQWVQDFAADPFPGAPLPPWQGRTELLDRYYSHTIHCRSCRQALANIQRWRLGLAALSAIAGTMLPWAVALGVGYWPLMLLSLLPLVAIAAWFGLGQLERQFYAGREIPPRNLPEQRRSA